MQNSGYTPYVFGVKADSDFKKMGDFISYAKNNPGKLLVGSPGVGSFPHFLIEQLKIATGIDITHLPLGGGGEVLPNLLGGHIDLAAVGVSILKPHVKAGKLRALFTTSKERLLDLPEAQTTRELGIPEVNMLLSYCFIGPERLPSEISSKLAQALGSILKSPDVVANLNRLGYLIEFIPLNQFRELLAKEFKSYLAIAKKAGIAKIQD